MKKIGLMQVKQALKDGRFRDTLPLDMRDDVAGFLQNPGCTCNLPLYRKVLKNCVKQLKEYFPGQDMDDSESPILPENHWTVINCSVSDLEKKLRSLGPGRKSLAITRYEDQVTVVINELESI